MSEPRWLNDEEQCTWRTFHTLQRTLDRILERDLLEHSGLSTADFAVLVQLSEAPQRRLRARDLGQQLDWDRSRLSHQIRRMEQRGIVARQNCPTDARGTFVALTGHGWTLVQRAAPKHVAAVRANFFDALDEADITALHALSSKIGAHMAARQPPDGCSTD